MNGCVCLKEPVDASIWDQTTFPLNHLQLYHPNWLAELSLWLNFDGLRTFCDTSGSLSGSLKFVIRLRMILFTLWWRPPRCSFESMLRPTLNRSDQCAKQSASATILSSKSVSSLLSWALAGFGTCLIKGPGKIGWSKGGVERSGTGVCATSTGCEVRSPWTDNCELALDETTQKLRSEKWMLRVAGMSPRTCRYENHAYAECHLWVADSVPSRKRCTRHLL